MIFLDQAPLFIERNAVAQDVIIVIRKIFRILPVLDLLQSRLTACLQTIQRLGILGLKQRHTPLTGIAHYNVTAAFSALPIRVYGIASPGKNTGQERMIEILFVVMVADGLT